MKTIKVNLYEFSELSKEAKAKAIQLLSDINIDHDWWECTYEDAKDIGLKIEGFDIGRGQSCEGEFTLSACEVAQNIFNNRGESCKSYKIASDFMEVWEPVFNEYMQKEGYDLENRLMNMEEYFKESLLCDYLKSLRDEYDYRTTEEAVIETIEANDYDFTVEGKLY